MGMPGQYFPSNITPAGLGDWTDGEVFRAITAGVSRDGKSLFPVMPYHYYGKMDREDIYSIMSWDYHSKKATPCIRAWPFLLAMKVYRVENPPWYGRVLRGMNHSDCAATVPLVAGIPFFR